MSRRERRETGPMAQGVEGLRANVRTYPYAVLSTHIKASMTVLPRSQTGGSWGLPGHPERQTHELPVVEPLPEIKWRVTEEDTDH